MQPTKFEQAYYFEIADFDYLNLFRTKPSVTL